MADFPTAFTPMKHVDRLASDEALQKLQEKGYQLWTGISPEYIEKLEPILHQHSIREYCPRDLTDRFGTLQLAEQWVKKGRAMFWLLQPQAAGDFAVAGYGWAGQESCQWIPAGQTTFAVRINEDFQGQGLATPFSAAMVAAAQELNQADSWWLESWQSNGGAVHVYQKLGFEIQHEQAGERPTADGAVVADNRLYMLLPPAET